MSNGWKNFECFDAAVPGNYPKNAILDGRETVWESKPASGTQAAEYRKVQTVQMHVNCNSDSTTWPSSFLEVLLEQQLLSNPVVKVGLRDGSVNDVVLDGTWQIERITENHNGDGTCRVDITLAQRGNWP
jgi:hypothetical protein